MNTVHGSGRGRCLFPLLLSFLLTIAPGGPGGAQTRPPNDDFAGRIAITQPGTTSGNNALATTEAQEPLMGGIRYFQSVWWTFTPTASGAAVIDTCGTGFDTVLAVYTGTTLGALSEVAFNDDLPGCAGASGVRFNVTAGTAYQIAVASYASHIPGGAIVLNTSFPVAGSQSTTTTLFGPFTGPPGVPLTYTARVSSASGTPTGMVRFLRDGAPIATATLSAGVAQISTELPLGNHQILARYLGAAGFGPSLSAAQPTAIAVPPPLNDNFNNRLNIPAPTTVRGSNVNATREAGEPIHLGAAGGVGPVAGERTVWWTFVPGASGLATINTCGSSFDTILAVYTGFLPDTLQQVAVNDDAGRPGCGARQSELTFRAEAGTSYHIVVAGWNTEAMGEVALNPAFPMPPAAPTTTTLAGPTAGLTGQSLTFSATVTANTGTPFGMVSFRREGQEFAAMALQQGVASVAATFPAGTHQITAHFMGVPGFASSASAARPLTIRATPLEFLGGGTVFGFTAACAAGGWTNTPHPARLRYGPGETNGMPSQVGILFPSGAEHLQTWQPLAQSTLNYDALGRQMWTLFVLQQPFPRMTPVQRRITAPANGTDIATATEVMLRLRVSGFGGIPGCGATVAGVLRRGG